MKTLSANSNDKEAEAQRLSKLPISHSHLDDELDPNSGTNHTIVVLTKRELKSLPTHCSLPEKEYSKDQGS